MPPSMTFRIGNLTIPHRLILAPMCGITLKPFRLLCKDLGAGLVVNQMVSAKALVMRDPKSLGMLAYAERERPVAMQIFGNDAETLAEAARLVQDTGVDLLDLNLGCPAKKIVDDGGGAALLRDISALAKIFSAMRRVLKIPFSIKIRAGWDDQSRNAFDVVKIAESEGVDALTLHARTRAQGYTGKSDWNLIAEIKSQMRIPLIGNGDVKTADDAQRMMRETNCDAVMTGRGAFESPWIFSDFLTGHSSARSQQERGEIILKQYEYFLEYFGESSAIKMMRKHLCAYSKGLRGGAAFRHEILSLEKKEIVMASIREFFGHDLEHTHS